MDKTKGNIRNQLLGRTNKVKTPTIAPYPQKKKKKGKAYAQHITTMILRINLEGKPLETLKHGQISNRYIQ